MAVPEEEDVAVAGLMLNGRVDALAGWFRAELSPSLVETFAPIPASRVMDPPSAALARAMTLSARVATWSLVSPPGHGPCQIVQSG